MLELTLNRVQATVAYAESMTLPIDLRFTDPASPLFIDVEGDNSETLFVISTSQVATNSASTSQTTTASNTKNSGGSNQRLGSASLKRTRDDGEDGEDPGHAGGADSCDEPRHSSVIRAQEKERDRIKKSMKAVHRADPASVAHAQAFASSSSSSRPHANVTLSVHGSMPPPLSIPFRAPSQYQNSQPAPSYQNDNNSNWRRPEKEPLFLPSSQLSAAEEDVMRESGLCIEGMDSAEALMAMLEDEGEEVGFDVASRNANVALGGDVGGEDLGGDGDIDGELGGGDSFDIIEDVEMEATQADTSGVKVKAVIFFLSDSPG